MRFEISANSRVLVGGDITMVPWPLRNRHRPYHQSERNRTLPILKRCPADPRLTIVANPIQSVLRSVPLCFLNIFPAHQHAGRISHTRFPNFIETTQSSHILNPVGGGGPIDTTRAWIVCGTRIWNFALSRGVTGNA